MKLQLVTVSPRNRGVITSKIFSSYSSSWLQWNKEFILVLLWNMPIYLKHYYCHACRLRQCHQGMNKLILPASSSPLVKKCDTWALHYRDFNRAKKNLEFLPPFRLKSMMYAEHSPIRDTEKVWGWGQHRWWATWFTYPMVLSTPSFIFTAQLLPASSAAKVWFKRSPKGCTPCKLTPNPKEYLRRRILRKKKKKRTWHWLINTLIKWLIKTTLKALRLSLPHFSKARAGIYKV